MLVFHTLEALYNDVYESYTDRVYIVQDLNKEVLIYADSGHTQVASDKEYFFSTWEAMLEAPVFFGRTLAEALPLVSVDM